MLTLQHTRDLGFKGTLTITEEVSMATNYGSHSMKSVYMGIVHIICNRGWVGK